MAAQPRPAVRGRQELPGGGIRDPSPVHKRRNFPSSAASRHLLPTSGEKGTRHAHGESPSPRVSGERVAEGRVRGSIEIRLHAPSTDRYTNRLPEFTADVARSSRRQIFFAATKG